VGEDASRIFEFANVAIRGRRNPSNSACGFNLDDAIQRPHRSVRSSQILSGFRHARQVWELCGNWAYKYPPAGTVLTDPAGRQTGAVIAAKGGDYIGIYAFVRAANRAFNRPDDAVDTLGFRLVREAKTPSAPPDNGYDRSQANITDANPTWDSQFPGCSRKLRQVKQIQLTDRASVASNAIRSTAPCATNRLLAADGQSWTRDQLAIMYEWILKGCA